MVQIGPDEIQTREEEEGRSMTMDNDTIKTLAKDGGFDELRAASPEILTKALKWLKKKMETYRENAEEPPLSDFIKYFVESGATMDDESIIRSGQQWRKRSGSIGSLSLSPDSPMVVEEGCTDMSTLVQPPPMVVDEADDQQPAVTEKKGGFKMPAKKVGFQPPTVTAAVSPASSPSSSSKGSMKKISKKNVAAKSHSSSKAVKAPKKEKDPNAPKKPASSYLLFCNDKREELKKADPTMKSSDMLKELGVMWKATDADAKQPYEDKAAVLKLEYTEAMARYRISNPDSVIFAKAPKTTKDSPKRQEKGDKKKKKKKDKTKKTLLDGESGSEDGDSDDALKLAADDAAADAALFPEKASAPTPTTSRGTFKRKAGAKAEASMQQQTNAENSKHIVATTGLEEEAEQDEADEDEAPRRHGKKARSSTPSAASSTAAADTVSGVAQRQKENQARSGDAASSIPALKGIKQKDLPPGDDLLHSKLRLSRRGVFPADFEPESGQHVALVLQPYRDFISSLTATPSEHCVEAEGDGGDTLATRLGLGGDDVALVEEVTAHRQLSNQPVVRAIVEAVRPLYPEDEDFAEARVSFVDLKVATEMEDTEIAMTVLFAPVSSIALTVDQYLLEAEAFSESLHRPFLRVGAQVRRCFSPPEDGNYGHEPAGEDADVHATEGAGTACQWLEGQVYSVRENLQADPYLAVKVVWLSQDMDDPALSWVYAYMQTDNDCSPWDLQQSEFVLPHHQQRRLPRALAVGRLRASSILDYLMSLDFTSVFRYNLNKQATAEFALAIPEKRDRVDLRTINKWAQQGRYDGDASSSSSSSSAGGNECNVGLSTLFQDLERMVHAGLKFNECNRDFLPWRQAEMTQQALTDLKRDLARAHPHLTCLRDAVALDKEREEEQKLAANAVVEV